MAHALRDYSPQTNKCGSHETLLLLLQQTNNATFLEIVAMEDTWQNTFQCKRVSCTHSLSGISHLNLYEAVNMFEKTDFCVLQCELACPASPELMC